MALVWSQRIESNHYEVRRAGATLRLYRNGVNHSQWNPNRPLSGCIWDLITLPALHRPLGFVDDVLILGFGAGSVGRQLRDLVGPKRIVGIDFDPVHLTIARDFFDCAEGCELIAADASEWVRQSKEESVYDLIIDDLYGESAGEPVRYAPMDRAWCAALVRLLRPGGMLVFNLVDPAVIPTLPLLVDPELQQYFSHATVFHMDGYDNHVVVFTEVDLDAACCAEQLRRIIQQYPRCSGVGKRYHAYEVS